MSALRLRQICLVAPECDPIAAELSHLFGLKPGYRDPHLEQWGVENRMLAVGPAFLEICAPTRSEAPAQRFLDRHPEGGGYIAIFNCTDLDRRRAQMRDQSVRIVTDLAIENFRTLQMHPADVGACMLEFNTTEGGEDWYGPYYPAGPAWQRDISTDRVTRIGGIDLRSNAPARLAARWSHILGVPVEPDRNGVPCIAVDGGEIRFIAAGHDEREGMAAVALHAANAAAIDAIMSDAAQRGYRNDLRDGEHSLRFAGIDFRLLVPPA